MFTLIFTIVTLVAILVAIFVAVRPFTIDDEPGSRKWVRGIAIGVATLLFVFIAPSCIKSVDATDVGVPITLGQPGEPLGPGPHFVLPWTTVSSLDVKTQVMNLDDDNEIKTVTNDRVQVPVDVSVYFHVNTEKAATLLLTVGDDYQDKIVRPLVRSFVYDKGSTYSAESIQNQREEYEAAVGDSLAPVLQTRGITLEKVEIRKIQLPDAILQNAQAKINAEETQKRTKIDAATRVIDAESQAKANAILAESVNKSKDVCQLLLVQALAKGQITQPLYVNPCGTESGTSPLITKSAN